MHQDSQFKINRNKNKEGSLILSTNYLQNDLFAKFDNKKVNILNLNSCKSPNKDTTESSQLASHQDTKSSHKGSFSNSTF